MKNILFNKAKAITEALMQGDYLNGRRSELPQITDTIYEVLVSGGDYQLIENDQGVIYAKTIVRDSAGTIIGGQG